MSRIALRAIDACLRPLQRLRDRIEPPAGDDDFPEVVEDVEDAAPVQKTLLHRALIVLMCLLLGAGAGGLMAYRGFSKALDSHTEMVERLQEDLAESRKDEVRSYNAKAKFQKEVLEYRKTLRETAMELQSAKARAEELNRQLLVLKPELRAKTAVAPVTSRSAAAPVKPAVPRKSGTCLTGSATTAADLQKCLDKFNSP
jgi:septal ring factor EnvC (AmiA/AmiB activator)